MIRLDFTLDNIPYIEEGIALTLGYFDGLHIGHLSLINEAKSSRRKSALLSFNMDGVTLKRNTLLTTLKDREDILEKLGVDYFLVLNFSKEVMQLLDESLIIPGTGNVESLNVSVAGGIFLNEYARQLGTK